MVRWKGKLKEHLNPPIGATLIFNVDEVSKDKPGLVGIGAVLQTAIGDSLSVFRVKPILRMRFKSSKSSLDIVF